MDNLNFSQIALNALNEEIKFDPQVRWRIGRELPQTRTPELDGTDEHTLLPLEIARCDLDDALIKGAVFAMFFQPDLLQSLVALEKQALIKLLDPFNEPRVVPGFHDFSHPL